MKVLWFSALVSSFPALAQQPRHVDRADMLAVVLPDSGAAAVDRVARVLVTRGHHLQPRDGTRLRLETEPLHGSNSCYLTVQALVMGHVVLLSGEYPVLRNGRAPLQYWPGYRYTGANFECNPWGWDELQHVAEALGGTKIVYFRHP